MLVDFSAISALISNQASLGWFFFVMVTTCLLLSFVGTGQFNTLVSPYLLRDFAGTRNLNSDLCGVMISIRKANILEFMLICTLHAG